MSTNNKQELNPHTFNQVGNTEGKVYFGDIMKNGAKMAVMIRNIFNSGGTRRSHYIGLQMNGELAGSTICRTPHVFQVRCGDTVEKDTPAFVAYADNGDMVIGAPNGRIRIFAQDIDLLASGNGLDTGFINIESNARVNLHSAATQITGKDKLTMSGDRQATINSTGRVQVNAGGFKLVEGADVSPVSSPFGSGVNTIKQQIEGLKKLIESIS